MIEKRKVAALIPYYQLNGEVFVFLQRRDMDAKRSPDWFGFFGGGIEQDETPEQAIKREIKEELDIEISDYEHFSRYEFYGSIFEVYTIQVDKNFSEKITVLEGQYGKFFTEEEAESEEKLLLQEKLMLHNFFGILKRNSHR